jgi:D-3-phosphoglycerate dehydrogenase
LRSADYIVLTCDLNTTTFHILDEQALALTPRGVRVVNVARGGLVDERALVEAMRDGHVAAAALDVMEVEPLPLDSDLRDLPVILGSHNASNSAEACDRTHVLAIQNLLQALENR